MSSEASKRKLYRFSGKCAVHCKRRPAVLCGVLLAASAFAAFFPTPVRAKQADSSTAPAVVQPGAPGKPSKTLPASTKATLPRPSHADVEFMQGMIMHH